MTALSASNSDTVLLIQRAWINAFSIRAHRTLPPIVRTDWGSLNADPVEIFVAKHVTSGQVNEFCNIFLLQICGTALLQEKRRDIWPSRF